jgi:hypothetical protein
MNVESARPVRIVTLAQAQYFASNRYRQPGIAHNRDLRVLVLPFSGKLQASILKLPQLPEPTLNSIAIPSGLGAI